MFRIIKKWYFKIYHLFKLIGIFILIFGIKERVYALETIPFQTEFIESEESCSNNLLNQTFVEGANIQTTKNVYVAFSTAKASYLIKVKENTDYYIKSSRAAFSASEIFYFTEMNTRPTGYKNCGNNLNCTFTTPANTKYVAVKINSYSYGDLNTINIMLNEGSTEMEYENFSTNCGTPTPPAPTPDTTYSSFLTLYVDKIEYLAEGFTSNPYLIAMIGIIIAWVILELFLRILHLRGGYKK